MKKKVKRIILATGHPWYFSSTKNGVFDGLQITCDPVNPSILFRGNEQLVPLNYSGTGNWNRVRLIMEILK